MFPDDESLSNEPEGPAPHDLAHYISYYQQHIRAHPAGETRGVIQQIQRLVNKGILTLDMIETALENYRADPFRRASDPRLVKHIRSFFTEAVIGQWQKPIQRTVAVDAGISALERLEDVREIAQVGRGSRSGGRSGSLNDSKGGL